MPSRLLSTAGAARRQRIVAGPALLIAACAVEVPTIGHGQAAQPSCGVCPGYGVREIAGVLEHPAVTELSGIAASWRHANVYYVQNDDPVDVEGKALVLHAIDNAGRRLASWELEGARVGNLEGIAVGPCAAGSCIYVADIGNNVGDASPYPVFRIPEPVLDRHAEPITGTLTEYDTLRLEYPDGGPHDCEAIMVHPHTADLYVVEKKVGSTAAVFRAPPWPADAIGPGGTGGSLTLVPVAEVSLVPAGDQPEDETVVGADIHPCGERVLMRTNGHVYEYVGVPGAPFEDVFAAVPVQVPHPGSSESIAYLGDGRGYVSIPEGTAPKLSFVGCD